MLGRVTTQHPGNRSAPPSFPPGHSIASTRIVKAPSFLVLGLLMVCPGVLPAASSLKAGVAFTDITPTPGVDEMVAMGGKNGVVDKHADKFVGATDKSAYNLFTQNAWYVGKLASGADSQPPSGSSIINRR